MYTLFHMRESEMDQSAAARGAGSGPPVRYGKSTIRYQYGTSTLPDRTIHYCVMLQVPSPEPWIHPDRISVVNGRCC